MAKHRTHSIKFKRQVSQEYLEGETLHAVSKCQDSLPVSMIPQ
ncbi:hypothetical protein [Aliihoeflea sp. 2WW]|nr:hypothetical protein [Aliihoeflea sp. 2WW]